MSLVRGGSCSCFRRYLMWRSGERHEVVRIRFLFAIFPRVLAYPLSIVFFCIAVTLLYKGYKLHRRKDVQETRETVEEEKR